MKKIFLTFICCFAFLLYIPFNTSAIAYEGQFSALEQITDLQLAKINELFNSHTNENLLIYYSYGTHNLTWSYDIKSYDSNNKVFNINERFALKQDVTITVKSDDAPITLEGQYYIIYGFFNNQLIFSNPNLTKISDNDKLLLLSTSYENIVRTRSSTAAASPQTRYYSYVDYDIRYTIKGANFDVYYLVDGTYKLIQSSINSFTIYNHDSKFNFKDSSNSNAYPDYPTIPSDSLKSYNDQFTLHNFLFKLSDLNSNNLIVKAPDTDNLLSDGNSNSQSTTTTNNQSNQSLDKTISQMDSLEYRYKNNLNNHLNNINVNDYNITNITQLSNAANFVRVQFDNLTKNNPFGTILGFSLFLGLSLLVIGKRL